MTRHTRLVTTFLVALTVAVVTVWPSRVDAGQGRAVRRSSGQSTGTAVPRSSRPYPSHPIYGGGGYYRPYYRSYYPYYYPYYYGGFYSPFYFSFGWGYPYAYGPYAYGPYGGYGYAPFYYGPAVYDNTGAARLQVTPRNTQVYVDGYFVGLVDEFDGYLQRLNVQIGEHDLQLYLDGHKSFEQKVLFTRGGTVKLVHTMQPLGPGETAAPPKPVNPPRSRSNRAPYDQGQGPAQYDRQPPPQYDRRAPDPRGGQPSDFGSLLLRVRPGDADILVDGEVWNAPEGQDQFVIELAEGAHRVEVRKNGFQAYTTTVRVRRGETVRLNVSLTSGGMSGE